MTTRFYMVMAVAASVLLAGVVWVSGGEGPLQHTADEAVRGPAGELVHQMLTVSTTLSPEDVAFFAERWLKGLKTSPPSLWPRSSFGHPDWKCVGFETAYLTGMIQPGVRVRQLEFGEPAVKDLEEQRPAVLGAVQKLTSAERGERALKIAQALAPKVGSFRFTVEPDGTPVHVFSGQFVEDPGVPVFSRGFNLAIDADSGLLTKLVDCGTTEAPPRLPPATVSVQRALEIATASVREAVPRAEHLESEGTLYVMDFLLWWDQAKKLHRVPGWRLAWACKVGFTLPKRSGLGVESAARVTVDAYTGKVLAYSW